MFNRLWPFCAGILAALAYIAAPHLGGWLVGLAGGLWGFTFYTLTRANAELRANIDKACEIMRLQDAAVGIIARQLDALKERAANE